MIYTYRKDQPGEKACVLFVHKWEKGFPDGFTKCKIKEYVEEKIKHWLDSTFNNFACKEIEVWIINAKDVPYNCCGIVLDYIYFDTAEYTNDEIMYPFSRLRPQLKPK
jgi:hypothetical protein